LVVALPAVILLKPTVPPLPEIAHDPLLVQGRELYFNRCASCHGEGGLGDGPSARVLPGGRAGNLTDAEWRYGHAPSSVLGVIRKGTPDGKMPGWESIYSPSEQRAVAAYVYFLARRPVPPELRASE
jgi:mono/diheme cytochrome c family protein